MEGFQPEPERWRLPKFVGGPAAGREVDPAFWGHHSVVVVSRPEPVVYEPRSEHLPYREIRRDYYQRHRFAWGGGEQRPILVDFFADSSLSGEDASRQVFMDAILVLGACPA